FLSSWGIRGPRRAVPLHATGRASASDPASGVIRGALVGRTKGLRCGVGTFSTVPFAVDPFTLLAMAWWYRVVELEDGRWACRWGLHVYDVHHELAEAIEHCSTIAAGNAPSEVFVHGLDAGVQSVASF
ncbi:MAG: hypothetical protein M3P18_25965, partial [Actinomycetota bacterium]|nr:hypothetical protein [Actinomycetota bacterium]